MKINREVFERAENAGSKVLVVTKYFDAETTSDIFEKVELEKSFLGLGENRVEVLTEKGIERDYCHFIGNIQSRKIPEIARYCSVVHSLDNIAHAVKFAETGESVEFFIQIKLDSKKSNGVDVKNFPKFLDDLLEVIPREAVQGISAIGMGDFVITEKIKEFELLKNIRDKYLPGKKISAGTSRDFEIALEEGIEIVRVGRALFRA